MARGRRRGRTSTRGTKSISTVKRCGRQIKSDAVNTKNQSKNSSSWRQKVYTNSSKYPWEDSEEEDRPDFLSETSASDSEGILSDIDGTDGEDDTSGTELDSTPSTSACAHAEIPICPWIEIAAEKLPKLELPSSSCDLLIHSHYLFDALEVYETCRCYYRSVRISPFLFEDFCAALQAEEQTNLLAEIHIALLKLALKDDEDDQILLSVQDTNNSFNIMIQLIEPMTYAEVLRQYLESDPLRFPSEVLKAASGNYPFVSVKRRLIVLSWLCDRFLHSLEYKNIVRNEGKILSDEHCRECGKPGDVLLCDGCEACYHLQCANLLSVPDGEWFCQICILHQVRGVTGINSAEFKHLRQPLRLTPIGYDRHGRRYWFLVRRIFVEDDINGTVVYYSTLPQLYEVINLLAVDDFEKHLATAIFDRLHEISSQMRITMELTNERNQTKTDPYLVAENLRILNGILNKPFTEKPHNSSEEKINPVDSVRVVEVSRPVLFSALEDVLGFRCGYLVDTFWSNGLSAENIRSKLENEEVQKTVASVIDGYKNILKLKRGFRIGDDRQVKQYDNQYSINDYAKRPHLRAKERDKKKYMCGRFSLADEHAFEWNIPKSFEHTNSMSSVGLVIQNTINKVATKIPSTLMHRLWRKDGLLQFRKYQTPISTIDTLKNALLVLECGIRRPALSSVWWGTLGHTRLIRITADDRERRLKMEQRKKKAERELLSADADEESDVIWVKYVRTRITHRHSLWRQKDEQFRINGRGALGGWLWVSSTLVRRFLPLPIKPTKEIYLIDQISEHTSIADKKAVRLETIIKKITNWRIAAELKSKFVCYSPSCRLEFSDICKHNRNISLRQCYSFFCRQKRAELDLHSEDVVHAYSPHIKEIEVDTELGLSKPFPFPTQHDFRVRRTGAQSLLVLPQRILKRLARQGGLNSSYVVPGFNRTAKSNSQVWNYPCYRPLFDHCWKYLTLRAPSYHAIALQLRILYACIRWADMERDPSEDICVTIHHPDYDEVRNVIGHKEWPPDGSYEQYKLQVQLLPLDDSNDISEESGREEDQYRPSRQSDISRNMRKRKSTKHKVAGADGMNIYKKVKVIEKWIDGVDLKLWEIINYWKKVEQNANYPLMPVSHFSSRVSLNPLRSHVPYNNSPLINRKRILTKVFDGDYNCEVDDNEDEDDDDDDDEEGRSREKRRVTPMCFYEKLPRYCNQNFGESNLRFRSIVPKRSGELIGGGKITLMKRHDGGMQRVVVYSSDSSRSARIDQPLVRQSVTPGSSRYSSGQIQQQHRSSPNVYTASAGVHRPSTPFASAKLFMIRRSDGNMHFIRPVSQIPQQDGHIIARAIMKPTSVSNDCGPCSLDSSLSPNIRNIKIQSQRNLAIGSLTDHAGMAQSPLNETTMRFQLPTSPSTRFVRVSTRDAIRPGIAPDRTYSHQSTRFSNLNNERDIIDEDPFMKRMATEKTLSGVPDLTNPHPESYNLNIRRRVESGIYGNHGGGHKDVKDGGTIRSNVLAPVKHPDHSLISTRYGVHTSQTRVFANSRYSGRSNQAHLGPSFANDHRYQNVDNPSNSASSIIVHHRTAAMSERENHNKSRRIEGMKSDLLVSGGHSKSYEGQCLSLSGLHSERAFFELPEDDLLEPESSQSYYLQTQRKEKENCDAKSGFKQSLNIISESDCVSEQAIIQQVCKEVLERIVSKICTWDRQSDWYKARCIKKPHMVQVEEKYLHLLNFPISAETATSEHFDVTLENRRTRGLHPESIAVGPVDPSEISLVRVGQRPHLHIKVREKKEKVSGSSSKPTNLVSSNIALLLDQKYTSLEPNKGQCLSNASVAGAAQGSRCSASTVCFQLTDKKEESVIEDGFDPHAQNSEPRISLRRKRKQIEAKPTIERNSGSTRRASTAEENDKIDPNANHCLCNQPYDPKKFYIRCDICNRWFHGRCVKITEKQSKKMSDWSCNDCVNEQKSDQEIYCVCKTPYDDKRFYVGCDGCQGWFHPECVGTTQMEVTKISEYLCPKCINNTHNSSESNFSVNSSIQLHRGDYKHLLRIYELLFKHRNSWPFREPVDQKKYPNYYQVIKKPMALSDVYNKMKELGYEYLSDFIADISQIFDNARMFNPKGSPIYNCAEILDKKFREEIIRMKGVYSETVHLGRI